MLYNGVTIPDSEDVRDTRETLTEGFYFAVLGRTAKVSWVGRDGTQKQAVQSDFFLVSFTPQGGAPTDVIKLMNIAADKEKTVVQFKSSQSGHPLIDGILYRNRFIEPSGSTTPRGVNFLKMMRRQYAKKLGALEGDTVNWAKIAQLAGSIVSFELEKDRTGRFLNINLDSLTLHDQPKVSEDNLVALYKSYDEEVERQAALRQASQEAASSPPAPPPDDELPF